MIPRLNIVVAVWGAWHRHIFLDKALCTILHESNLPAMGMECRFLLYTNESNAGEFAEAQESISKVLPCEVRTMQLPDGYKTAWQDATVNAGQDELMMFLQADIVWSKGSFPYIAELIKAGKRLIYMPHMRGTEPFYPKYVLPADELMRIVREDAHPVNKSQEVGSFGFTRHPETVLWPVKGGWVARLFAREPLICPASMRFNGHNLPQFELDRSVVGIVESSDKACGVSLASRDVEWDHYRNSNAQASAGQVGSFANGHQNAMTLQTAELVTVLRYGEMNPDEVSDRIVESRLFMEEALEWIIRPGRLIRFPERKWK